MEVTKWNGHFIYKYNWLEISLPLNIFKETPCFTQTGVHTRVKDNCWQFDSKASSKGNVAVYQKTLHEGVITLAVNAIVN